MRQESLDKLEQDYLDLINYLNSLYDQYPTNLIHIQQSEEELSEQSYYDALGLEYG